MRVFVLVVCLCAAALTACGQGERLSLRKLLDSLQIPAQQVEVLIDKSERLLSVRAGARTLRSYPVVFGDTSLEAKLRQGDYLTPEGNYRMISKYPHRSWTKFVWINYPNAEDRKRFAEAKKSGLIPKNAEIGGEIGIHGVPEGMDHFIDEVRHWTLGCISLKTKDINDLYPILTTQTPIIIQR